MKKTSMAGLIIVLVAAQSLAKPWRGITPLHCTKSEVDRVLGPPIKVANHWATYKTEVETVSILYSNGHPCGPNANSEWNVSEWTVVSITVAPTTIVRFSTLKIDESKYRLRLDPERLIDRQYLNEKEGELITVANDEVSTFRYWADSTDSNLKCPKDSAKPMKE